MIYAELRPSPRLASFIKCFWALEYSGSTDVEPVLPDGCPEIVFNLSDRFLRLYTAHDELQPSALFAGQMSRSIAIRPTGNVNLFGVRFQPAGALPLLRFPMSEITDRIIDLASACGRIGEEVEWRINEARSLAERVAIFESFFVTELAARNNTDAIAAYATETIVEGRGLRSISSVSAHVGVSDRRLERRFKRAVGVSPKTFSRIVRFQAVVNAVQLSETPNMLDTALSYGYYDQSHLIRDFRGFSGDSPSAYFERTHQLSDVFTGAPN
jgi:AraC-like DNA-binding protein